ncbi:hypothetical protein [Sinorhizobium fredii]|uniref:hypothetical protein n=1 Tax=Rhizobium fredii TaxID=380 RepID=UPI00138B0858|nr:hypothetical protein [Sinorhizobium fredii]
MRQKHAVRSAIVEQTAALDLCFADSFGQLLEGRQGCDRFSSHSLKPAVVRCLPECFQLLNDIKHNGRAAKSFLVKVSQINLQLFEQRRAAELTSRKPSEIAVAVDRLGNGATDRSVIDALAQPLGERGDVVFQVERCAAGAFATVSAALVCCLAPKVADSRDGIRMLLQELVQ